MLRSADGLPTIEDMRDDEIGQISDHKPSRAGFDPNDFTGRFDFGLVMCNGYKRGVGIEFELNAGTKEGLFVLTTGDLKKSNRHFLGAEEWPKFLAMVRRAEHAYRQLLNSKQCDELTPLPPE